MRTFNGWACDFCNRLVQRKPMDDSFRESRMREICSSGSTRGEGGNAVLSYSTGDKNPFPEKGLDFQTPCLSCRNGGRK